MNVCRFFMLTLGLTITSLFTACSGSDELSEMDPIVENANRPSPPPRPDNSNEDNNTNNNSNDNNNTNTTNGNCSGLSTFFINLSAQSCNVALSGSSIYQETRNTATDTRTITCNSIPDHLVGSFPNSGNPNTIREQRNTYQLDLTPSIAGQSTGGQGYEFGILFSGVTMDPYTAEFFQGSNGQTNRDWNITTLTSVVNLGLDCNNAHVQPSGKYHYHGTPNAMIEEMGFNGNEMMKVGYAADGFPIYYKYGYDEAGSRLIELQSGYQLKTTDRGGDGISAPAGCPDGTYFQDYEYASGVSLLDACNGRWGKTPESDNEYYYVITDNFPSSPLCFSGTPSSDFRAGQ